MRPDPEVSLMAAFMPVVASQGFAGAPRSPLSGGQPRHVVHIEEQMRVDAPAGPRAGRRSPGAACLRPPGDKAICEIARDTKFRVVAEGVEAADVLEALKGMVCDEIQGYLLAKPMPADELLPWLKVEADRAQQGALI